MASVETEAAGARRTAAGWRTFRVRLASEPVMPEEIVCPASAEAGRRRTCATCKACGGARASTGHGPSSSSPTGARLEGGRYEEAQQRRAGAAAPRVPLA